jgi:molybdenum cofactor cytidylyltransferase
MQAMTRYTGSIVFLLADQPFITPDLVRALVDRHHETLAPVVAPFVGKMRGNPVLFDRDTIDVLNTLEGDSGGRQILGKYEVEEIQWDDPKILIDIDTPEDYQTLLNIG